MNYDQQQQPGYGNQAPSPYTTPPPPPQLGYSQQPYQTQPYQAQPYQSQPYQSQPYQAQTQMTITGGNKNALNKPYDPAGQREWSHGLCDCTGDCSTCCAAWFCPCMIYNSNISRRRHLESHNAPHREGGDNTGGDCCTFLLIQWLFGCGCLLNMSDRGAVRQRYSVQGDSCVDCLASAFCLPCALTQQSREIEEEERSFVSQVNQGYVQHGEK